MITEDALKEIGFKEIWVGSIRLGLEYPITKEKRLLLRLPHEYRQYMGEFNGTLNVVTENINCIDSGLQLKTIEEIKNYLNKE